VNELLRKAAAIATSDRKAVEIEQDLLNLGFYNISFPNRGPIRAWYLGVEYKLEG
jgi:hypothetical protein